MMATWSKSITSFSVISDQKYYNYGYLLKIQSGCGGGTGTPDVLQRAHMSVAQLRQGSCFNGGGVGGDSEPGVALIGGELGSRS